MTRTTKLVAQMWLGALAMAIGCGGIVSLGDPGNGKDSLGGLPGEDSGLDGGTTIETGGGGGAVDAGADWPGMMTGLDGSVPDGGTAGFTEFIWQRWWACDGTGGPVCKQEFWVNAECVAYYNDRDILVGTATLSDAQCQEFQDWTISLGLGPFLLNPPPCATLGPNGGKIYELHTNGHEGPKYRKRVDGCATSPGVGQMDKLVLGAVVSIPGYSNLVNTPHISME